MYKLKCAQGSITHIYRKLHIIIAMFTINIVITTHSLVQQWNLNVITLLDLTQERLTGEAQA
jgi:hypothetical protein